MVVLVADHSSYLPLPILVLPQGYELGIAHTIFGMRWVVEAMNSNLHCPISLEWVHLERVGEQSSLHPTADVLLNGREERSFPNRKTGLIVIELQVVGHHRSERCQVAVVIRFE